MTTTKPGGASFPFPGIAADLVDASGTSVPLGSGGYLVLKRPWPAMLRGIYGDPERYKQVYWSRFPGMYFAGDGAKRDEDGYYWLLGRVDDVMNVAGHGSTRPRSSALVSHPTVAEAAVVSSPDPVTGEAIFAYVILKLGVEATKEHGEALRNHVAEKIGPIAKPKTMFTPDLPKTRSGKIVRRLLRDIAGGRALGDTTYPRRRRRRRDHPRAQRRGRGRVGRGECLSASSSAARTRRRREPATRLRRSSLGGSGLAFDGLTEEWRLVGRMQHRRAVVRALNKRGRSHRRRPLGAGRRVGRARRGVRAPECRPL